MKRKSVKYYKELLNMRSKNMAYIDPIRDIGTFDSFHMEFKEPIEELINPWTKKPFSPEWYPEIEKFRQLYLKWQKAQAEEDKEESTSKSSRIIRSYVRNSEIRLEQARLIRIYLQYGFSIPAIARAVEYAEKTIRNSYAYSRHVHLRKNSTVIVKNRDSNGRIEKVPFNRYFSANSTNLKHYLQNDGWYLKKGREVSE